MLDYERVIQLYKKGQRVQAVVTLVTMLYVILLGVTQGLGFGEFYAPMLPIYQSNIINVSFGCIYVHKEGWVSVLFHGANALCRLTQEGDAQLNSQEHRKSLKVTRRLLMVI